MMLQMQQVMQKMQEMEKANTLHLHPQQKVANFAYPVPEMESGQSFADWKYSVELWRAATSLPKVEHGMANVLRLPMQDSFGGLRRIVSTRVGNENLRTA